MKVLLKYLPIFLLFFSSVIQAETSESVSKMLAQEAIETTQALKQKDGQSLLDYAINIQDSGIDTEQVYETAIEVVRRMHQQLQVKSSDKIPAYVSASLIRLIAASKNQTHRELLVDLQLNSPNRKVRNLSKTLLTRKHWYQRRNTIMNDFSNHDPANSLQTTRFLNLVAASDITFARYAAESLTRQNNYDPVVVEAMAKTVKEKYKNPGVGAELDSVAWLIRFIGRTGDFEQLLSEIASYPTLF